MPELPPLLDHDPTCFSHSRHCHTRSCSSLPCFPRNALLISPDGNAKASQRLVKFLGSLSPPQRPPCHIQQCQTACPWPRAALCTSRHCWTVYYIQSPLQTHRAEPHTLLSLVKAQGLLTPHAHSGGSGCAALKRKSHSKILHKSPGVVFSSPADVFSSEENKAAKSLQQKTTHVFSLTHDCVTSCNTEGITGHGSSPVPGKLRHSGLAGSSASHRRFARETHTGFFYEACKNCLSLIMVNWY